MENSKQWQLPQSQDSLLAARGTTSFPRTCFNGLNVLSGIGVLSVPLALSSGGWFSLIFLLLIAVVCWYTGLLLKRCMDSNSLIETYPDIGEKAFGYKGRALVSVVMNLELYLFAVELLILEGDNLTKLFPDMDFRVGGLKLGGKQGFVLLTALVVLPTTWLRSLDLLAYISAGGAFCSVVLVGCVLWVGTVDGVGFHEGDALWNWQGLPMAISLFAFCYTGHTCYPTLYESMKNKSSFSKVLLVTFTTSTAIYASMAVMGYLMYGEHLMPQVTLNLPDRKVSAQIAIYTTAISPLTKYALIITPMVESIEGLLGIGSSRLLSILVRTAIVTSTVIVALTVPFFGYVMAFIGAFPSINGSIVLPCLCYLRINKAARCFGLELVVIIGILIVGAAFSVLGTYTSLKKIIAHL